MVAVLGRRASGEWTGLDRERFRGMLHSGAFSLVLSLLPLPILDAGFDEPTVWGWSSGIGALACVLRFAPYVGTWASPLAWSNPEVSKISRLLETEGGAGRKTS